MKSQWVVLTLVWIPLSCLVLCIERRQAARCCTQTCARTCAHFTELIYITHQSGWPRCLLEASIVWNGGTKMFFIRQLRDWQKEWEVQIVQMGGGRGRRQQCQTPVNLPGFADLLLLDCLADAVAVEGENILFLKTQEAGFRGESGGGRRQWEQQHDSAAREQIPHTRSS